MQVFKNRRDAILEIHSLEDKSDLLIFMGRVIESVNHKVLSKLDCNMIADELSKNTKHLFDKNPTKK